MGENEKKVLWAIGIIIILAMLCSRSGSDQSYSDTQEEDNAREAIDSKYGPF